SPTRLVASSACSFAGSMTSVPIICGNKAPTSMNTPTAAAAAYLPLEFLAHDVFFAVDFRALNFAHAMALESLLVPSHAQALPPVPVRNKQDPRVLVGSANLCALTSPENLLND